MHTMPQKEILETRKRMEARAKGEAVVDQRVITACSANERHYAPLSSSFPSSSSSLLFPAGVVLFAVSSRPGAS